VSVVSRAPQAPVHASLTTAITIAASTKMTIATCIHTQVGDMRI
jgi:hypothetical protein